MAIVTCSEHFSEDELKCKETGKISMSSDFLEKLERVRVRFGKSMVITSGFRDITHSAEARKPPEKRGKGYHCQGRACDIAVSGADCVELIQIALEEGMGGIGVAQKGGSRFLHLDDREEKMIWSY
jgi:zinc D-Ala-D-Ala carboxypeptidase